MAISAIRKAPANIAGSCHPRPGDQQPAQPAAAYEGGDRGGHYLHVALRKPGDDQGERQRQLDVADHLTLGHAQRPGGVHCLPVGPCDARGVAVRMAGSASRVSTNTVLPKPVPSSSTTSTNSPRLGIGRAPLVAR